MLKYVMVALALISAPAFAKKQEPKCNTKFVNPIQDERINFTSCAVDGAMIGILNEAYGDVLCLGTLKSDAKRTVYAFKGEKSSQVVYYEEVSTELYRGAGDQESGIQIYKIKLKTLNASLEKSKKERRTTLTHTRSWMYSDGSDVVKGKLPGARENFEASVYYLGDDLDRELKEFADEVCKK